MSPLPDVSELSKESWFQPFSSPIFHNFSLQLWAEIGIPDQARVISSSESLAKLSWRKQFEVSQAAS